MPKQKNKTERALVSVIIPAKNEAKNIGRCLDSVSWADDVVVIVDHLSTDKTQEIAASFDNVNAIQCEWRGYAGTKIFGAQSTRHPWILWLDADEMLSPALAEEIRQAIAHPSSDAYDFPRITSFLGEWVNHCGWYPGRVVRLFHKDHAHFNNRILHEGVNLNPGARLGHLKADLYHFSYNSLAQYFDKMNQFGLLGAQELLRKGRIFHWRDLILRPPLTFLKSYFLQQGFLDGFRGFVISVGSAFSMFIRHTNLYYLERRGSVEVEPGTGKIP